MKIYRLLFFSVIVALFGSCEETFEPGKTEVKYKVEDSDDPLDKMKYHFYKEYQVVVLDSFDVSEYGYTGGPKLAATIIPTKFSKEQKIELLQQLEASFYGLMPDLTRKHAPFKLLLADTISVKISENSPPVNKSYYVTPNLFAIGTKDGSFELTSEGHIKFPATFEDDPIMLKDLMLSKILNRILDEKFDGQQEWGPIFTPTYGAEILEVVREVNMEFAFHFGFGDDIYFDWETEEVEKEVITFPDGVWPGGGEETGFYDYDAIDQWLYNQGFPGYYGIRDNWGFRLRVEIGDHLIKWLLFKTKPNAQELLDTYPKLNENFQLAKKLFEKHLDINI